MTTAEVAAAAGITTEELAAIEDGTVKSLQIETALAIARALKVKFSVFMPD
jgi:DNA-binding XRE family transcriptional regulator